MTQLRDMLWLSDHQMSTWLIHWLIRSTGLSKHNPFYTEHITMVIYDSLSNSMNEEYEYEKNMNMN